MRRWVGLGLLMWALAGTGAAPAAGAATLMHRLENALMCTCDDKCGKVMINCTCDTAKETRKDFARRLESGLTVDQIIKVYVDKHGETVLSAPTKSGFNLSAWITPFLALVAGGVGVRKVLRSWVPKARFRNQPGDDDAGSPAAAPDMPAEWSARVRQELDRLET